MVGLVIVVRVEVGLDVGGGSSGRNDVIVVVKPRSWCHSVVLVAGWCQWWWL